MKEIINQIHEEESKNKEHWFFNEDWKHTNIMQKIFGKHYLSLIGIVALIIWLIS